VRSHLSVASRPTKELTVPFVHRPRHRRRPTLQLLYEGESCSVVHPDPDEPITITGFAEAAALAFELVDLDVNREALVLLDERRHVTAILLDPPAAVGVYIGRVDGAGLEVPFMQTLSIVFQRTVAAIAPQDEIDGYHALRRVHMLQGLLLLDVILTDGERVQSMAIASDPDAVWFESFGPIDNDAASDADSGDGAGAVSDEAA
jgi:hypothetical protein